MKADSVSIGDRVFVVPVWNWRVGDWSELAPLAYAAVVVRGVNDGTVARLLHGTTSYNLGGCERTWSAALRQVHATVVADLTKCAAVAGMLSAKIHDDN